jgi:hypothetical protein
VYHVQIREFPHSSHAYNLDSARLHATVVNAWVRGEIFEFAGREWIPQRSKIAILEGDELPLHALSMGRGWNNARRKGKDVTEAILEAAKAKVVAPSIDPARHHILVENVLGLCAKGPVSLAAVWDRAELVAPQGSSGEWLVLAQTALLQLLTEGRVLLCAGAESDAAVIAADAVEPELRLRESWTTDPDSALFVRAA